MLSRRIQRGIRAWHKRQAWIRPQLDQKVEIACVNKPNQIPAQEPQAVDVDNNSCVEGSVIGGLLGAGLGAALSRKQGRWVGVPVGAAAGAMVGCQVDGG